MRNDLLRRFHKFWQQVAELETLIKRNRHAKQPREALLREPLMIALEELQKANAIPTGTDILFVDTPGHLFPFISSSGHAAIEWIINPPESWFGESLLTDKAYLRIRRRARMEMKRALRAGDTDQSRKKSGLEIDQVSKPHGPVPGTFKPDVQLRGYTKIKAAIWPESSDRPANPLFKSFALQYNSPIEFGSRGVPPRVMKQKLLSWYYDVERKIEEHQQHRINAVATSQSAYSRGREGIEIVLNMSGAIKKRKI
jgi:hypothetical protein